MGADRQHLHLLDFRQVGHQRRQSGASYGIIGGLAYATYWLSIPLAGFVITICAATPAPPAWWVS